MAKRKMRKFADGGLSSAQEEWLGGADRTDPYILSRMRSAIPDAPKDTYENNAPYKNDNQGLGPNTNVSAENKPSAPVTKTISQTKVSVTKPQSKSLDFSIDEEGNKLPTDVKKPYIAIPKRAAGMQQYRSDATSPIGNMLRKITGSSIGLKKGGKVSSASKRADGCAIRGKTRA